MLVKVVFLFPTNMKFPFCQKSKDGLFLKNTPKDDISSITEKMIFILEKMTLAVLELLWRPDQNTYIIVKTHTSFFIHPFRPTFAPVMCGR